MSAASGLVRRLGRRIRRSRGARWIRERFFPGSRDYWEQRYATGGLSGSGSYGRLAKFKAEFLNEFVARHEIRSVIELGCGDGNQLSLAEYPSYVGFDVSRTAVRICEERFRGDSTKRFVLHDATNDPLPSERADLALSLDVVYHLVEDEVFEAYMRHLFGLAERFVIVYSSNEERAATSPHVRHRRFTDWVEREASEWRLREHVPNRYPTSLKDGEETSHADFYVFERT